MNLERILAENMLRFGVKNLSTKDKFILNEQAKPGVSAYGEMKAGNVVWVKNFEETKNVIKTVPVTAQFYNNMVSYEKGMLPAGQKPFIDGLNNAVAEILNAKPETVRVTITGQATNLTPKMQGYNWATKQTMPLDHDYDKVDIEQSPAAGNEILATKRAETAKAQLIKLLGGKIPDIEKKITVTPRIVPGTISDDKLRMVEVEISAANITQTPQWLDPTNLSVEINLTLGWAAGTWNPGSAMTMGQDMKMNPSIGYSVLFNYSTKYPANTAILDQTNYVKTAVIMEPNQVGNVGLWPPEGGTIDANGKQVGSFGNISYYARGTTVDRTVGLNPTGNENFINFIKSCGRFNGGLKAFNDAFGSISKLLALVNKKESACPANWEQFKAKFKPHNLSDFTGAKVNYAGAAAAFDQDARARAQYNPTMELEKSNAAAVAAAAGDPEKLQKIRASYEAKKAEIEANAAKVKTAGELAQVTKTTDRPVIYKVTYTFDELIDVLGLAKNPTVDKLYAQTAVVVDKTVNPETTQKVSAMPTPPGDLAASGVKIIKTNK